MKRKLDFVTNSSSTSFVGLGVFLTYVEILQNDVLIKKCFENYLKYNSDNKDKLETPEDIKNFSISEILEFLDTDILSFIMTDFGTNPIIAGLQHTQMEGDETLNQFRDRISSELKSLGINKEIMLINKTWYD